MTIRQANFEAIGTHWVIQVRDDITNEVWSEMLQGIYMRIDKFDKAYSRFRPDSLIVRMSTEAGKYDLPSDGYKLLNFYEKLYKATDGKVTPLIGQTLADSGYDATYSFKTQDMKAPPKWEDVLSYNTDFINLEQPALLDFGAAGKGYLVDIISEILQVQGFGNFTINASGDILHRSTRNDVLHIGLENPLDTSEAVGIVSIKNQSLCASAGSKRKWKDFNHIINPTTLKSPRDIIATWVIANDTMTADGLATALFFTPSNRLIKDFSFSYAALNKDMQLSHSNNFPVRLFEQG